MAEALLILRILKTIIGVVGILDNGLVILVISRVKFMHTLTNTFICHQAVIDLSRTMSSETPRMFTPFMLYLVAFSSLSRRCQKASCLLSTQFSKLECVCVCFCFANIYLVLELMKRWAGHACFVF